MKEIELFYLASCPYCRNAKKAIGELTEENPAYGDLRIRWIEESEQPEIAEQRDYYSVPTIFWNGEKLYEAHFTHSYADIKDKIRAAFDRVLAG
ncbi:MAG: glutaredoxin [Oscillospiraceae bacterium]|nr:glutaredoxin [Oscillospiraceae bacterium]